MSNSHVSEEQIIDFVLQDEDMKDGEYIREHLSNCEECSRKWKEWVHLLESEEEEEEIEPSPMLKQRLHTSISLQSESKGIKRSKKPFFAIASSAAILLLCFSLFINFRSQDLTYKVTQNEDVHRMELLNQPNTSKLDIIPASNHRDINGNVWINDRTNELFVEVNGLSKLTMNDYQLWVFRSEDDFNSELLQLDNGSARVYYRGDDVTRLTLIKASIEPLGGSESPTGPDTFYVDLNQ